MAIPTLEYKTSAFETKDVDEAKGVISGYAAVYGNVDDGGDVIEAGAGAKTIAERGTRIKALYGHDFGKLVGHPTEIREDDHGLYTVTKIAMLSFWGKEVYALAANGSLNEMSIGYSTMGKATIDPDTGVRYISEFKLYEYSFVPLAMNSAARVDGVKAALAGLTAAQIAEWCADYAAKAVGGGNLSDVQRAHVALTAALATEPDAAKGGTPLASEADRQAVLRRLKNRPVVRAYLVGVQ